MRTSKVLIKYILLKDISGNLTRQSVTENLRGTELNYSKNHPHTNILWNAYLVKLINKN